MQHQDVKKHANSADVDFHGAAIVDHKGCEVPITEDMVQDACYTLTQNGQTAAND